VVTLAHYPHPPAATRLVRAPADLRTEHKIGLSS
jgi:hypothetical protein